MVVSSQYYFTVLFISALIEIPLIFAAFSPSKVKQSSPRMITIDGLQHIQRHDQNDSLVGVFRA
jgi:hypothetical protein